MRREVDEIEMKKWRKYEKLLFLKRYYEKQLIFNKSIY